MVSDVKYGEFVVRLNPSERSEAYKVLRAMGLGRFSGAVMYVLGDCFGLDSQYMLCAPDTRLGTFLLDEIQPAGNFGKYDSRLTSLRGKSGIAVGLLKLKRLACIFWLGPSEVLWAPGWKIWHWGWRKVWNLGI